MTRARAAFHASLVALIVGATSLFVGCDGDDDDDGEDQVATECNGHGVVSGGACVCDAGYMVDPDDPGSCIEIPTCGDNGHWEDGACACDAGYMIDPEDAFSCIEIPPCDGYGQLNGETCVCDEGYAVDPADGTSCIEDNSTHEDGVAVDVELHLHANDVKIDLYTMAVLGEQDTEFDLFMGHDDPVDGGPNLHLGPGVTAQNLGSSQDYHAVSEAPADGYLADDPGSNSYVIGSTWRNGGSGTTGFSMSENVYALRLANGTYAKVEVLSAQSGTVHVLCYLQPDGSDDLSTTLP